MCQSKDVFHNSVLYYLVKHICYYSYKGLHIVLFFFVTLDYSFSSMRIQQILFQMENLLLPFQYILYIPALHLFREKPSLQRESAFMCPLMDTYMLKISYFKNENMDCFGHAQIWFWTVKIGHVTITGI